MSIPTIIIPGLMGSKLIDNNSLEHGSKWSIIPNTFENIYDLKLQLSPNYDSENVLISNSLVDKFSYEQIFNELKLKNDNQVFLFSYDWRLSNKTSGEKLYKFVKHLGNKLSCNKFNFVTHSMGGIVFSCYLKTLFKNDKTFEEVNKAVISQCPFKGSVKSLSLLFMDQTGPIFPLFNTQASFRKVARTFPSVFELTPYYKDAIKFKSEEVFDLYNIEHWQSNIYKDDKILFSSRLNELKNFRDYNNPSMQDLSKLPDHIKKNILILIGSGEPTKVNVEVNNTEKKYNIKNFFNFNLQLGNGDGSVPLISSNVYKNDILTLKIENRWNNPFFHALFLNDGRVQTIINRFLFKNNYEKSDSWWEIIGGTVEKEF